MDELLENKVKDYMINSISNDINYFKIKHDILNKIRADDIKVSNVYPITYEVGILKYKYRYEGVSKANFSYSFDFESKDKVIDVKKFENRHKIMPSLSLYFSEHKLFEPRFERQALLNEYSGGVKELARLDAFYSQKEASGIEPKNIEIINKAFIKEQSYDLIGFEVKIQRLNQTFYGVYDGIDLAISSLSLHDEYITRSIKREDRIKRIILFSVIAIIIVGIVLAIIF